MVSASTTTPSAEWSPLEALVGAELWARMAAAHGGNEDIRRLASVLMMRAGFERQHGAVHLAACLEAEALSLLDVAADHGDKLAASALAEMVGEGRSGSDDTSRPAAPLRLRMLALSPLADGDPS